VAILLLGLKGAVVTLCYIASGSCVSSCICACAICALYSLLAALG